jgi:hypothetical protein
MTTDTGKIVVPGAVGLEEMSYGENTLEKDAAEIGFKYQSLKRLQAGLRRVPTGKGGPVHQFMVCAPRARRARSP